MYERGKKDRHGVKKDLRALSESSTTLGHLT